MTDSNLNEPDEEKAPGGEQEPAMPSIPPAPQFPEPPLVDIRRPVQRRVIADRANRGVQSAGFGLALAYSGLTPAVSALIGYSLDGVFGTAPWLVVIFLILGAIAGFFQLIRGLDRLDKSESDRPPKR